MIEDDLQYSEGKDRELMLQEIENLKQLSIYNSR